MNIELSDKEFRRLLDLVYIGNWILNSIRTEDRFEDYDLLQEKFFGICAKNGLHALVDTYMGKHYPSRAYEEGGIQEAIADYEDTVFFHILAEEMALRDMQEENIASDNLNELYSRTKEYMAEFDLNGIDTLRIEE